MTIALPRSGDPRVSIIIPCSVRTDLLMGCLQSLARHIPAHIPYETIVVLNGTGADVEAQLRAEISGVEIVRSPINLGVAGAGNLGRSRARGQYIALTHDDAEILPGWIEALIEAADTHPEAGAVGGKVLSFDGRLQAAGSILWREAMTTQRWAGESPPASAFERLEAVDYCGTCSLLVRANAWDAVGGLDEDIYPAYFVDVNLCLSLRHAGYAVLVQPLSAIHHHMHSSTRSRFRSFIAHRNRERLMAKWAAELAQQEPFDRLSPSSIERAIARAQAAWERCRARPPRPAAAPPPFDPVLQQAEHEARARDLQTAYRQHLEATAESLEAERDALLLSRSWRVTAPLRYLVSRLSRAPQ
jgi:GT2 family glycosyltransferase